MDSPMIPLRPISLLLRTLLFLAACFWAPELVAQTQSRGTDAKRAPTEAPKGKAAELRKNNRGGAGAARAQIRPPARPSSVRNIRHRFARRSRGAVAAALAGSKMQSILRGLSAPLFRGPCRPH